LLKDLPTLLGLNFFLQCLDTWLYDKMGISCL